MQFIGFVVIVLFVIHIFTKSDPPVVEAAVAEAEEQADEIDYAAKYREGIEAELAESEETLAGIMADMTFEVSRATERSVSYRVVTDSWGKANLASHVCQELVHITLDNLVAEGISPHEEWHTVNCHPYVSGTGATGKKLYYPQGPWRYDFNTDQVKKHER